MSVSNTFFESFPSIPSLLPLSESPRTFSIREPNPPLQPSEQVEKAKSCATSVFSGIVASIATRNPVPFLIGFCGCLPKSLAQQKIGNEFQVNTYTDNNQNNPSVESFSNGHFMVVWVSDGQDGSLDGIFGQLFTGNATKIDNEFQVNTYINNHQNYPSVMSLSNGNLIVTWQSYGQDGFPGYGIFGRLFAVNGSKIGNEFQVNSYAASFQQSSSVTSLSNSNFVVTWQSLNQDSSGFGVYGQIFSANATKIGNEFQVNTYTNAGQELPSVASLNNDSFVVTWQSSWQDGDNYGIYGQLFAENATKIGQEFQVNTYTGV
ncbi:MAG: hypothetical protein KR126chlam3_01475 [Chlamydiae bacterium]|nr:hypothetical protein [Chlamydiota bacterium]